MLSFFPQACCNAVYGSPWGRTERRGNVNKKSIFEVYESIQNCGWLESRFLCESIFFTSTFSHCQCSLLLPVTAQTCRLQYSWGPTSSPLTQYSATNEIKGPHTTPRCPTALSDHSPITPLPLVWPVQQKRCIEHTALTCCLLHSSVYVLRLREMQ